MDGFGPADPRFVAGMRDRLAGGHRARPAEAAAADALMAAFPVSKHLPGAAWGFHDDAAVWAVRETELAEPAQALVFTGAGLPRREEDGPLHARAVAAAPAVRVAYVEADASVVAWRRAFSVAPDPGRVVAVKACPAEPAEVLQAVREAGVPVDCPVSVHLVLVAQWWRGDVAARVIACYARLLAPGSSVCLSVQSAAETPEGDAWLAMVSGLTGRVYRHSAASIRAWFEDAGMRVHPEGVTDARAWDNPGMREAIEGAHPPVRVCEAVGIVRDRAEVSRGRR